jgi:hypothetical protein
MSSGIRACYPAIEDGMDLRLESGKGRFVASAEPFSGPCVTRACVDPHLICPINGVVCSDTAHPCLHCPKHLCHLFAGADSTVWVARITVVEEFVHKALLEHGQIPPAFRWLERYARFRHAKHSNGAGQSSFQYHLEKVSFLHGLREVRSPMIIQFSSFLTLWNINR